MARPNKPTLVFPNGGEDILTRVIEVSWTEAIPVGNDDLPVWYEVYYSEFYDPQDEPEWKMIASVPQGIRRFEWKVGNFLRSDRVRVAVCAVNTRGERSEFSVSANYLTIRRAQPSTPSVLNPVPGGRYGSSIEIIFDDSAVKGTFGQRAKYYLFFSSDKAGVPLSPVAQKVPVGTGPLLWDTSLVKPADDYVLTVYLADDIGNKSAEVNVRDLNIVNEGFFLIDTKPPSGFLKINDGDEFTRDRDVSVEIFSFDEVTGSHAMQFQEDGETGTPESVVNVKYHMLTEGDGVKTLKMLLQDYGANRSSQIEKTFRPLFDVNNSDISDIILDKSTGIIWVGVNGSDPSLYKIDDGNSFLTKINEPITSLSILNSTVYISVDTTDDTALVYRFTGFSAEEAISLSDSESEVLSMDSYKGDLYLGSLGGTLYKYDETSVNSINTFDGPIDRLYSDSSLLYILIRNQSSMFVYDGVSFTEVDV